jgi:hypothetical protein
LHTLDVYIRLLAHPAPTATEKVFSAPLINAAFEIASAQKSKAAKLNNRIPQSIILTT